VADWRPSASLDNLRARAELLTSIRQFFDDRNVLEVETPLLARATATDVHIQSLQVSVEDRALAGISYLQTSPEFAMKRLLANGTGPIYQICKAFRDGEHSKRHNQEFTMLEWYRPAYSMAQLIDEVEQLVDVLLGIGVIQRLDYRELFLKFLQFDPHTISLDRLAAIAHEKMDLNSESLTRTDYLQLLLASCIEPMMPSNCFIYDFPVEQAALAKIEEDDQAQLVAKRFELYCSSMEIANGYFELTDATEQRSRLEADLEKRTELQLAQYPIDEKLIAALEHGIPDCAGVAVGVDRLLMLLTDSKDIDEVIAFPTTRT